MLNDFLGNGIVQHKRYTSRFRILYEAVTGRYLKRMRRKRLKRTPILEMRKKNTPKINHEIRLQGERI